MPETITSGQISVPFSNSFLSCVLFSGNLVEREIMFSKALTILVKRIIGMCFVHGMTPDNLARM